VDPEAPKLSLEEWKYELAKLEHCMITPNRRVQFEDSDWFQREIFTFGDSIYQSWLF